MLSNAPGSRLLSRERLSPLALGIVLVVTIGCHAALLPLGKWQPDEFIQFHNQIAFGWHAVADRIFAWSPRPVSEVLIWGYGSVVNLLDRPLIVPCLAILWAGVLLGIYAAARCTRLEPALIALTLFAAFLLLRPPSEAFYWPIAALCYLPGLGALGAASLIGEDAPKRPWLFGLLLVVAAWSTEIAATYVLINAGLLLAAWLFGGKRVRAPWQAWSVAVAAAALVLTATVTHRLTIETRTIPPLQSCLAVALPYFLQQVIAVPFLGDFWDLVTGLAIKGMLFLGFRPPAEQESPDRRWDPDGLLRGIALLLAAFASIVVTYRQYGVLYFERHETFRQGLVVLAIYGFAQAWPTRQSLPARAALLTIPLAAAFAWRIPDIAFDWSLVQETLADNAAIWQSGRAPGSDEMEWRNPPAPRIANGWLFDSGTYVRTSETEPGALDWQKFSVLVFFGKHRLYVP